MPAHPWPSERIESLRALWNEGHSAMAIARIIGEGLSRNAVIGKAHRIGLTREFDKAAAMKRRAAALARKREYEREKDNRRRMRNAVSGPSRPAQRSTKFAAPAPERAVVLPPEVKNLSIHALTSTTCRWPLGDGPYLYCGVDCPAERPYCAYHHQIAYRPYEGRGRPRKVNTPNWDAEMVL